MGVHMEILFIILTAIYLVIEILYCIISSKKDKNKEKKTLQSLYKLMEVRVLNRTLQNRISSGQAAEYEYQQWFVRVECVDAKPWLACMFALDEPITIGRSMENKISIRDDLLSRTHCKIVAQNGVMYLQDMGTTNGTKIKRGIFRKIVLMPNNVVELRDGDVLHIGHFRLKLRLYYGNQMRI